MQQKGKLKEVIIIIIIITFAFIISINLLFVNQFCVFQRKEAGPDFLISECPGLALQGGGFLCHGERVLPMGWTGRVAG